SCMTNSLAFCEAIEPVIEAVTNGHPARVPAAAQRAQRWWRAHRAHLPDTAAIAPTMRALTTDVAQRHVQLAARDATIAATASLDGCTESPNLAAQLMRVELAGLAGWQRAHNVDVAFPR